MNELDVRDKDTGNGTDRTDRTDRPDGKMAGTVKQALRPALRHLMTEDQFARMTRYVCQRLAQLRAGTQKWHDELDRAREESSGDFERRVQEREAQIFIHSNETANIVRSAADFVAARIRDDIFGTEPWFMVVPERTEAPMGMENPDATLATQLYEHAKWKLANIGWKSAGREAIKTAVDMGTAILKTTWKRKVEVSKRFANVLVHAANPNEAVTTGAGDFVFQEDATLEQRGVQGASGMMWHEGEGLRQRMHEAAQGAGMGQMGQMGQMDQSGGGTDMVDGGGEGATPGAYDPQAVDDEWSKLPARTVAAKDVNVVIDVGGDHAWGQWLVDEVTVRYDDPCTEIVDYRNFFAPLDACRLEDVDYIAHVYDRRLSDIRAMLPKTDPETADVLALVKSGMTSRKEPARMRDERSGGDEENPWVRVAECYFDYDPLQNGNTVRVYLVVLPDHEVGLSMGCDFLANVIPEGEYPFSAVVIGKKKNQWMGTGFYEMSRKTSTFIDRSLNAMIFRNDIAANPLIGVHEDALSEKMDSYKVGPGEVWHLEPNKTLKDAVEAFEIPQLDVQTFKIAEFFLNLYQAWTGVTSAAQGVTTELPQINTATGTNAVLASGNTMGNELVQQIRGEVGVEGLIDHLDKTLRLLYTRQNRAETFLYGEGEFRQVATLTPEQVAGLKMKVHLLLTRFRQKQDEEAANTAITAITEYIQLPEPEKEAARPLFVQLLKAKGFDNADALVRKPMVQPAGPPAMGQAGGMPPGPGNGTGQPGGMAVQGAGGGQ